MNFNKIKLMTSDPKRVIEALKDSTCVEFNDDYTKIRRASIIK